MVPVFDPYFGEQEIEAVVAALRRGEISGTFGSSIPDFEQAFADYCGCKYGVAVSSGTTALHLAVAAAGIGPGDEVLVSASTNIATALAVYHNGAVPVPIDSEPITWNLDLDLIEAAITERTKAIMPVHLYGHPVEMRRLCQIAARHKLLVIEDCAESHGATCHGQMSGSFGQLSCFSFYANKVLTTGEGGMVLTSDEGLAEKLRLLRNLGFTTPRFRHEVAGYNFRMTGYQAAFGLVQVKRVEELVALKRQVAQRYNEALAQIPGLKLPAELPWARNVYWMYAITVEPEFGITRDQLVEALRREQIETRTFFCPMNQQPVFQRLPNFPRRPCPVAERIWETGLYLPSAPQLTASQIQQIAYAIQRAAKA
jgi:perosamine synthetase